MPTPIPTNPQIESVREIAKLLSFAEAESHISSLNNEQWEATLSDITSWEAVKDNFTVIKGRSGVDIDPERTRLAIRNRVRGRLGLAVIGEAVEEDCDDGTESIPVQYIW